MNPPINSSRSSVPLQVYRELIKELQISQEHLEALKAENQALVQENQQLRQTIAKIEQDLPPVPLVYSQAPPPEIIDIDSPPPQKNGWLLGVLVFLIVVSCGFGTFWAVRSLVKR